MLVIFQLNLVFTIFTDGYVYIDDINIATSQNSEKNIGFSLHFYGKINFENKKRVQSYVWYSNPLAMAIQRFELVYPYYKKLIRMKLVYAHTFNAKKRENARPRNNLHTSNRSNEGKAKIDFN